MRIRSSFSRVTTGAHPKQILQSWRNRDMIPALFIVAIKLIFLREDIGFLSSCGGPPE